MYHQNKEEIPAPALRLDPFKEENPGSAFGFMPNEEEIAAPKQMWYQIKEEKPGPGLVELQNEQMTRNNDLSQPLHHQIFSQHHFAE